MKLALAFQAKGREFPVRQACQADPPTKPNGGQGISSPAQKSVQK